MSTNFSRRKILTAGFAAAAGASGLAAAASLARRHGLLPPDARGFYAPGHALTYAAHRLLAGGSLAREFPRSAISARPFANGKPPEEPAYQRLQAGGFLDWRFDIAGLVARPASFSLAEIRSMPSRSQITSLACEEGWSFIAEWTGVPLATMLERAGVLPQAKYLVFFSIQEYWRDSIDMNDAFHPQTLITWGMNGSHLPPGHGGPLRLLVPRQLGYKSLKYITRLVATDNPNDIPPTGDYSWYAGI
jgi:DMSO/TMAO reductase YedYZ molybdopterin-dependent catalytic subunit